MSVHASEFIWSVFSGGSYYILFSISVCVLFFFFSLGAGSSMLMKSAMLLDLEFQHEIPFMKFIFPYPFTPIFFFFCDSSTFPISSKIQLCWTACNSPKLISFCFCKCSYLFLVIVRITSASTPPWKNSELRGWAGWLCWTSTLIWLCNWLDVYFIYWLWTPASDDSVLSFFSLGWSIVANTE